MLNAIVLNVIMLKIIRLSNVVPAKKASVFVTCKVIQARSVPLDKGIVDVLHLGTLQPYLQILDNAINACQEETL